MDDLDHSGFVVNKHVTEFEILDSKIAKEIMKIILADFKKRSISWKNKQESGIIVYQIFSFFGIKKKNQRNIR